MELFTDDPLRVEKARMATRADDYLQYVPQGATVPGLRGISVYNPTSLIGQSARDRSGRVQTAEYQMPFFTLTVSERVDIFRMCGPVFGVVTGRMNRVAGLEWKVTTERREEDRTAEALRVAREVWQEQEGDPSPRAVGVRVRAMAEILRVLPDVRYDLGNFDAALLRWSRRIKRAAEDRCSEVEDWLRTPNQADTFEDLTKKVVFDLHVHGLAAPYKEVMGRRVENVYELPGGTCYPIRGRHVGDPVGIVQVVDGLEAQLYYSDEVCALEYAPYSGDPYGAVPLEALVNKVAETLMFDARAAEMADGTRPPEKLIAFGDRAPWGSLGEEFEVPLDRGEQKRVETLINEARKEAVRVISGHGTPVVVDVSRADTFQYQSERQRMVREEVGLVFGASNAEMNLTGTESTSGRDSADTQERYDLYKGIYPHVQALENMWNLQVLPFRAGPGLKFQYEASVSERAQVDLWRSKLESGLFTPNEVRTEDMGRDPFRGGEYDRPRGAVQQSQPPSPFGGVL